MNESAPRQFGFFLLFWILYFVIILVVCSFIYGRVREQPPKEGKRLVSWKGRTVTAVVAWEEKDRLLRKTFLRIGMGLMILPLILPLLLRLIG